MKVFILVILLIPIFAFYIFVNINAINSIKLPASNVSEDTEAMLTSTSRSSRRASIKVIK